LVSELFFELHILWSHGAEERFIGSELFFDQEGNAAFRRAAAAKPMSLEWMTSVEDALTMGERSPR
jgi:hypothetical protein